MTAGNLGETVDELREYSIEFGDKFDKNYRYYFMGFAGLNDGYSFGNSVAFTATDVEGMTVTDILGNTSSDNYVYWEQPLTAKGAEGGNTGNNGNDGNAGTTTPTDPSKPEETTPNNGNDTKSPQTGDNSNIALWFALLFVSCGGVIGAAVYSKRKNGRRMLFCDGRRKISSERVYGGGLVLTYMVIRNLGMVGTRWALIIPGCTNSMMAVMMKSRDWEMYTISAIV